MSTIYKREGNCIYFGSYPQSLAGRVKFVCKSGNYLSGVDGEKYARVNQSFFKVEPIRWRILCENQDSMLLMSDRILESRYFYRGSNVYSLYAISPADYLMKTVVRGEKVIDDRPSGNNYAHSDVRSWLISNFYNKAFSAEEKKIILKTEVNNGALSTGFEQNVYACENTFDKVFLLSYEEAFETYGLNNTDRQILMTDYVKLHGEYKKNSQPAVSWWLRSPYNSRRSYALSVDNTGANSSERYVPEQHGIVPAICIKL